MEPNIELRRLQGGSLEAHHQCALPRCFVAAYIFFGILSNTTIVTFIASGPYPAGCHPDSSGLCLNPIHTTTSRYLNPIPMVVATSTLGRFPNPIHATTIAFVC